MKKIRYKDIDLSFTPHPITGDISKKIDDEDVKQSLRNLILTHFYERPDPSIGTNVYKMLFELDDTMRRYHIKKSIFAVANYEPRAEIEEVFVSVEENNKYKITILFKTSNTPNPIVLTEYIDLVRG